jgi:hypothetical protein
VDSVRGLSARAMVPRDGRRAIVRQPLLTRRSTSDALASSGMTGRAANLVGRANPTTHLAHIAPGADAVARALSALPVQEALWGSRWTRRYGPSRAPPNPTKGKHPARPSGVQSFRNHQTGHIPLSKIPLQAVPGSEAPGHYLHDPARRFRPGEPAPQPVIHRNNARNHSKHENSNAHDPESS